MSKNKSKSKSVKAEVSNLFFNSYEFNYHPYHCFWFMSPKEEVDSNYSEAMSRFSSDPMDYTYRKVKKLLYEVYNSFGGQEPLYSDVFGLDKHLEASMRYNFWNGPFFYRYWLDQLVHNDLIAIWNHVQKQEYKKALDEGKDANKALKHADTMADQVYEKVKIHFI